GICPRKAGYAIATALTTGSKSFPHCLWGESICALLEGMHGQAHFSVKNFLKSSFDIFELSVID
ncbi:hypothetical protein, partial [Aquipseudomonas alcaligenes]